MKFNNLIKALPFFFTLVLIVLLSITNQKEYSKLRLLIWNTPSLSLGTYLGISTGTGFLLSYIINTNLAKLYKSQQHQKLKFNDQDNTYNTNEYEKTTTNQKYDNVLIERDINEPSPTVNAIFRVVGRTEKTYVNNSTSLQNDEETDYENDYLQQPTKIINSNQVNSTYSDWSDESYSNW